MPARSTPQTIGNFRTTGPLPVTGQAVLVVEARVLDPDGHVAFGQVSGVELDEAAGGPVLLGGEYCSDGTVCAHRAVICSFGRGRQLPHRGPWAELPVARRRRSSTTEERCGRSDNVTRPFGARVGRGGGNRRVPWERAPPALVAQLDRASDYGSEGWGFESLQAR